MIAQLLTESSSMAGLEAAIETSLLVSWTIGVVEVAKRMGMPAVFAPLCAVVTGVVLSYLEAIRQGIDVTDPEAAAAIFLLGVFSVGLAAVGAFSAVKNVARKVNGEAIEPPPQDHVQ